MSNAQPFPQPDPEAPGPAADSAPSAAAEREADLREVDEISAIALALLRALHVEVMDPESAPNNLPGERVRAGDSPMAYSRLTRVVRVNLAVRARMVEGGSDEAGAPAAIARQDQIRLLNESSSIGMDLLRTLQQEVVDPDNAPTARQGLRVGAGDPALALSRIARAIRLNHAIKSRILEGTLGRQRQSRSRSAGQPGAPFRDSAGLRDPARRRAASARGSDGASNSAAERGRETGDSELETDGIEDEREDLFGELNEDFEDGDEFAGLDGLSLEECMAIVRRDFARCFTGKARVPGTGPSPEPPGCDEPPGPGRPRGGLRTSVPPSVPTGGGPVGLRTWLPHPTAAPGDSSDDPPAESAHGHSRDPPSPDEA
jgi:hypothetical protein